MPTTKTHCESIPIPNSSTPFFACAGVADPDQQMAMAIVSTVMFGALPTAAWSTAFKKSRSKPILIFWILLLAFGHTFWNLITPDPNLHFQICPKDNIEALPEMNYQPPLLDQSWRNSLNSIASTKQQSSRSIENGSSPACIYSCFATTAYTGRRAQDVGINGFYNQPPFKENKSNNRLTGILFWWGYTLLAVLTLLTTEKKGRLPQWAYKLLFSLELHRQPSVSILGWKRITHIAIIGSDPISRSSGATSLKIHVTILKLIQLFTQLSSVAAFFGSILHEDAQNTASLKGFGAEPAGAVGQWGNLVVVMLVLLAAGLSWIWGGRGARSTDAEMGRNGERMNELGTYDTLSGGESSCSSDDIDVEMEKEDWDCRVGYAS